MKTPTTNTSPSSLPRLRRFVPFLSSLLTILAALFMAPGQARAQVQLLANPAAETGDFTGWTIWDSAGYDYVVAPASQAPPYGNDTNSFQIYGNYNNAYNYNGMYQVFSANPGEVFNASGYVYQLPNDSFAGDGNRAYLEVQFKDINGNVLSDYQSAFVTNGSPTGLWYNLVVNNETSPVAGVSSTNLVAPANTVSVEYDIVFYLNNYGGGSTYWDNLNLTAQISGITPAPVITNVQPGTVILATNANYTFTALAQSGVITNVVLTVLSTNSLVYPVATNYTYTLASTNLTVTGLGTATATVSLPLTANLSYSIAALVTDSHGNNATAVNTFDTIRPVYVWEAEDFNFDGGQTTNTPANGGVDLFAGLVGTTGIDENWINNPSQTDLYRPSDAVSIGGAYETPRQKFQYAVANGNTNALDYEVGYNTVGDWEDYTRTFPTGNYNIYARMAVIGSAQQISLGIVGGSLTGTQTVTNLGYCNVTDNGYNSYLYCPLVDSFGNLITVPLSGTQTIRSTVTAGGPNINFYMIVPATGSPYPALINSYPTGNHPFEPTNKFSFTVGPAQGSAISTNSIVVTLNGVNITSNVSLTAGVSNEWTGTFPISLNSIYTAVVHVTNSTQLGSTYTFNFDTFSQTNFMWEAEDFDFNGGQFIDNPMPSYDPTISGGGLLEPNSYCGFPDGNSANSDIPGIDDGWINVSGQTEVYRVSPVSTQVASDYLRQKFITAQTNLDDPNIADVNIGYWTAGSWLNYTRTYPTGTFHVYGRLGGAAPSFGGTTFAIVTNGVGTTSQQTNVLGTFSDPAAAGYQTWHWIELMTNGVPAVVSLNGVSTFTITSGGDVNANFYMLVPAPLVAGSVTLTVAIVSNQPAITFPTASGHTYTLYYKNNLTDASWISLNSVAGDGMPHTLTDTTSSGVAHRFYMVQIQ